MNNDMNIKDVFLGDRAENVDTYNRILNKLIDDHMGWREKYVPEDMDAISFEKQIDPTFIATNEHMGSVLHDVSKRLR